MASLTFKKIERLTLGDSFRTGAGVPVFVNLPVCLITVGTLCIGEYEFYLYVALPYPNQVQPPPKRRARRAQPHHALLLNGIALCGARRIVGLAAPRAVAEGGHALAGRRRPRAWTSLV